MCVGGVEHGKSNLVACRTNMVEEMRMEAEVLDEDAAGLCLFRLLRGLPENGRLQRPG